MILPSSSGFRSPWHRPHGRPTLIREVRLVDPDRDQKRTGRLIKQYYHRGLRWPQIRPTLDVVLAAFEHTDHLADLVTAADANEYLCGAGGARYLDTGPFIAAT